MRKSHKQKVEGKRRFEMEHKEIVQAMAYLLYMRENYVDKIITGNAKRLEAMRKEKRCYCSKLETGCGSLRELLGKPEINGFKIGIFKDMECYSQKGIFCEHYQPREAEASA